MCPINESTSVESSETSPVNRDIDIEEFNSTMDPMLEKFEQDHQLILRQLNRKMEEDIDNNDYATYDEEVDGISNFFFLKSLVHMTNSLHRHTSNFLDRIRNDDDIPRLIQLSCSTVIVLAAAKVHDRIFVLMDETKNVPVVE